MEQKTALSVAINEFKTPNKKQKRGWFSNSLRPHGTKLTKDTFWNDWFFTLEGIALAVGVLSDHPEVVHLVLHQISDAVCCHIWKKDVHT